MCFNFFFYRKMSHHKQKMVCTFYRLYYMQGKSHILTFSLLIITEIKHQHDPDDDSGIGPSTFTDAMSTTFSEVSHYIPPSIRCVTFPYVHCFLTGR